MPRVNLTDRFVAHAKPGASGRTDFFDEKNPGLTLRVSESGRRTWCFVFTSPKDGRRARANLGSYPAYSLGDARARATEAKSYLEDTPPRDPRDVFKEMGAAEITVAMLCDKYVESHAGQLRSGANIKQRLRKNVMPLIGSIRLAELHRRDVNRVIEAVRKRGRGAETNRNFETMRAMFNWAVRIGDLDISPIPAKTPRPLAEKGARERFLSDDEVRHLWNVLPAALVQSKACQKIVMLCLVTGQRVGEVAGMRFDELDLKKNTWSLPASRTKNRTSHLVPLSALAVELIEDALADAGDHHEFVFPSPVPTRHGENTAAIAAHAVGTTIRRALAATKDRPRGRLDMQRWSPHALRHTVLTGMAALGVAPIVIGNVANHLSVTKAGVTFAVYVHHTYEKEKRSALDLWAERLAAVVDGGETAEVVPIRNGAQHK